jgi:hypothetical protein
MLMLIDAMPETPFEYKVHAMRRRKENATCENAICGV